LSALIKRPALRIDCEVTGGNPTPDEMLIRDNVPHQETFFFTHTKFKRNLIININHLQNVVYGFRLVPKSVTLNDLERRNGHYFALFRKSD